MGANFLMFDYETLSSFPLNAAVISFGAIIGNWDEVDLEDIPGTVKYLENNAHYCTIKTKEQITEYGLAVSKDTVGWWSKQNDFAQQMLQSKDKVSISQHGNLFTQYCIDKGLDQNTITWVRAPQFDHTILENIFNKINIPIPYNTWKVRDVRTAIDIVFDVNNGYIPGFREMLNEYNLVEHYAVHDCIKDILQLKMVRDTVGL